MISNFVITGKTPSGTLIQNIFDSGFNPLQVFLGLHPKTLDTGTSDDGLIDSLRFILDGELTFGSESHNLVRSLTKAF